MARCWSLPLAVSCWGSTGCRLRCRQWPTRKPDCMRRPRSGHRRHRSSFHLLPPMHRSARRSCHRNWWRRRPRVRPPQQPNKLQPSRRSQRRSRKCNVMSMPALPPIDRSARRTARICRAPGSASFARNNAPDSSTKPQKLARNRLGAEGVASRHGHVIAGPTMQFLVYLTVLMVSISTVLLEVHWLTSPAPQPKPAVQAANVPTAPRKVEGPTAALSPVYPKPADTTPAPEAATAAPNSAPQSQPQQSQAPSNTAPAPAAVAANPEPQKPAAETTGVAARAEDNRESATATAFPAQATTSNNRCDVQGCSSAYQSFRASDCTYQPFEGPRRFARRRRCSAPRATRASGRRSGANGAGNETSRRATANARSDGGFMMIPMKAMRMTTMTQTASAYSARAAHAGSARLRQLIANTPPPSGSICLRASGRRLR